MHLINLPYELLLYLLKDFMELDNLWCLSQVSRYLRRESIKILMEQWEIDFSSNQYSLLKMQFHSAVVSLSQVSRQLIHRIKIVDQPAFPSFILFDKIESNDFQELDPFSPAVEPNVDNIDIETGLLVDRLRCRSRRPSHLLTLETKLNGNMFRVLKSQIIYPLDLDCHIKLLVGIVVHHAVIIQGKSIQFQYDTYNNCRVFSAVITGFLSRCTSIFPNRSMTSYLMKDIIRFFEQASYRLLSLVPRLSPQFLLQFKLSCTTKSNHKCFRSNDDCQFQLGARNYWSCISTENKHQDTFILILHSMAACGDLIGASFNAALLKEINMRCIVLKLASILRVFRLDDIKRSILTDLKETWFISHIQTVSPDFIVWLQSVIEDNP